MIDSKDIRRVIVERLHEIGRSESWLSQQLGRNRGYINEYLKGTPEDLPYETKVAAAEILGLSPERLGVLPIGQPPARSGGFAEDAVPYDPPRRHFLSATPHIAFFLVKSNALDQRPEIIKVGDVLAVDINKTDPRTIETGRVVLVQLYDKRDIARAHGTIIRQFLGPNKLHTNSSGANDMFSLDDTSLPWEPVIKGTVVSVIHMNDQWARL